MVVFTAGVAQAFGQAVSREYQLKAVLVYNLTQFVEWPESAFATNNSPLVIGVLGPNHFGTLLDDAVRGEKYQHRPIVVQRFRTVEEAKNCQILFISSRQRSSLEEILPPLNGLPILTVADFEGFTRVGGIIRFYTNSEDKIRLEINLDAAQASGLSVSAKLLRVAETVRSAEK